MGVSLGCFSLAYGLDVVILRALDVIFTSFEILSRLGHDIPMMEQFINCSIHVFVGVAFLMAILLF